MKKRRLSKASDVPASWSRLGERNVGEMIRLADSGNVDAGQRLLSLSARWLRDSQPLPLTLASWLAARLDAVIAAPKRAGQELRVCKERGHPSKDMHAAVAHESLQQMAAWAVFHDIYPNAALTPNFEEQPTKLIAASKSVSDWLAEQGWKNSGKAYSVKTIEAWYYARRDGMIKETCRLQEILSSLNTAI